jgi:hypothetical protein
MNYFRQRRRIVGRFPVAVQNDFLQSQRMKKRPGKEVAERIRIGIDVSKLFSR